MTFNTKDRHIVISYHYIRDPDLNFSGIHPCPISEFEKQINFLSKNYEFASIPKVYNAALNKKENRLCALTFDDGFKDNYINAIPILKKYGAKATFFVIPCTWDGIIPSAHKIHILLSRYSASSLIDMFNEFVKNNYKELTQDLKIDKENEIKESKRIKFDDDFLTDNFKEKLTTMPGKIRKRFLDDIFKEEGVFEKKEAADLFMSINEIKDVLKDGFFIGNHGYSHEAIDVMDEKEASNNIKNAEDSIKKHFNIKDMVFSYPYGRTSSKAVNLLKKMHYKYAVTIERKNITNDDDSFAIPRYDCNDLRDFLINK